MERFRRENAVLEIWDKSTPRVSSPRDVPSFQRYIVKKVDCDASLSSSLMKIKYRIERESFRSWALVVVCRKGK